MRKEPRTSMDPLTEAVRSLRDEDLRKGVGRDQTVDCARCKTLKMAAGSKTYGDTILCNDCVLSYARACFVTPGLDVTGFARQEVPESERAEVASAESYEAAEREIEGDLETRMSNVEAQVQEIMDILEGMRKKNPKLFKGL